MTLEARNETHDATGIHAIPVMKRWLLLAPASWKAALVNAAALDELRLHFSSAAHRLSQPITALLRELDEEGAGAGDDAMTCGKLVIIPTRSCNMRCVYCDFTHMKSGLETLDPLLACRLADHYAGILIRKGMDVMRVHFFGGEPLVAIECIQTIVHYVRQLCARKGLKPWFELTTNGFCDPVLIPFVGDYFDSVIVSLDGTADLHDYNRRQINGSGTYERIAGTIRKLSRYPAQLCLRLCVTNRSAGRIVETVGTLLDTFDFDILDMEMLAENEGATEYGLSAPDPYDFATGVLKAEIIAGTKGVRVVHGAAELDGPRRSSCPMGQGSWMLNPDGRLTACYVNPERWAALGVDIVTGSVDLEDGVTIHAAKQEAIDALTRRKPRCERCFCRYTCAGGCHLEQTPPGCAPGYDSRCRAIRAITVCRLLRRIGCDDDADLLANDRLALARIGDFADDRLVHQEIRA